jgi:glycosyltransferase involved in cell wall biosynthesis
VHYDNTEGPFSAREVSNDIWDFAEKIECLINDRDRREQMKIFGQNRFYNELHWGIESRKYLAVYDRLFES